MSKTLLKGTSTSLAIFLLSFTAHSAMMLDIEDSFIPLVHDQQNENSPAESFPLFELPVSTNVPWKSTRPAALNEEQWKTLKEQVLSDFKQRMSYEFQVPAGLQERTSFWFDIYTKYGEAHHIIHHVRYPWIVYKVVDTTDLLLHGKGPTWLKRDRAQKFARKQAEEVRQALRRLNQRKSYEQLPPLEKEIFEKLQALPGSRKAVIRLAASNVRSQLGQKDFFAQGLSNSSRYLPYMEEEFRKANLPIELTRMPFVESSFNESAYSKVGASGIWQIMPRTGKAYMIVNESIDERNSPLKATRAAARLLRSYYRALESWPLAITSYNHGIGNIQKAIKFGRSKDLATIVSRYHDGDFRFASSNFFTCFLAALYAERYSDILFKEVQKLPLQEREVITLAGATRAKYLLNITGLETDDLLKYNLDLRHALKKNSALPRGYQIHLPPGFSDRFQRQLGIQEKPSRNRRS